MLRILTWCLLAGTLTISCHQRSESDQKLPGVVDFNQHIRPILSNHCYVCHGPDISSREAGLRLDKEAPAKTRTDRGIKPIVEGSAQKSAIYQRIISDDPEKVMPPPSTNRILTAYEKGLIGKWIDQGAEWKEHWSFIPPVKTSPVADKAHPVDSYMEDVQNHLGLTKSNRASTEKLQRRLSYLITGLPPDIDDLGRVIEDSVDYDKYVDQLLESPQYGERWARHWMDLARYAEGRGHEFDYPVIGAWQYRDYLIRVFNNDVTYNQFIKEQLAGDLLSNPRINKEKGFNESVIGTVFLNMHEGKHSPVDTKDEEKIRIDNMIDVTSKTFSALTVACARCHDHKFDDIPTTDYYAMYGMFESSRRHLYPMSNQRETKRYLDSIAQVKEDLVRYLKDRIEAKPKAEFIAQKINQKNNRIRILGDFTGEDFGNWMANGLCFGNKTNLGDPAIDFRRKEAKINSSGRASSRKFSTGISGALRSRTFTIEKDYLIFRAAGKGSSIRVVMDNHQLIQNPIHGDFAKPIDSSGIKNYYSYVGQWKGNKAYIEILPGEYYSKQGKFHHFRQDPQAWIEVEYVVACDSADLDEAEALMSLGTGKKEQLVYVPESILSAYFEKTKKWGSRFYDTAFVGGFIDGDNLQSPVFIRGDHRQLSEEKVRHRFLSAIPVADSSFANMGSDRLAWAESLASVENPLTARVIVNRIWHHLFGRGLVSTVDNFGLQGTLPTHPELLDHLALQFMEDGWSIKKMIKYIVTSETFKQSTATDHRNLEIDPENKYLHAFPVRRLEAEAIRDGILAASGRLNLSMYGESIPLHLTDFLQGRGRPSASGPLDGAGRRSIYQAIWRNFLPPFMTTFDMPIPFSTFGDRSETNVPAQSLTLLNDPFVQGQAEVLARYLCDNYSEPREKIETAYLRSFSRYPNEEEVEEGLRFITDYLEIQPDEPGLKIAAWKEYCHSLFNAKEFIYLL